MRKNKQNQRRCAPTRGGGIDRNTPATWIGTGWRIPSESGGDISGTGNQQLYSPKEYLFRERYSSDPHKYPALCAK